MALNTLQASGWHGRPNSSWNPSANLPGNTGNQNHITTNQNIRNAGRAISEAVGSLTGRGSVFGTIEGRTSDADVASVRVDSSRLISSMPPRDTTVNVQQTAQAQVNTGDALTSSARAVDSGVFRFSIEAGGRTHEFNINVLDSDDNASVHRLMANAINSRNIGVTASIQTGTADGAATSALTLTASRTGTNNAFSVTDTTGNLTATMGVSAVDQQARNAVFSINGGQERVSQTNEISLAAGVTATLRGEGETNITFAHNAQDARSAVTDLVNSINSAMRNTNAGDGRGSARFLQDLHGLNRTFASALGRIGIEVQNNGQLAINENRLNSAIEDGSVSRFFENRGSGFVSRVERLANNAVNTNHYVNAPPPVNFNNNNFNFGNTFDSWSMFNLFG
jgi:flagellar hook-associated protein 2